MTYILSRGSWIILLAILSSCTTTSEFKMPREEGVFRNPELVELVRLDETLRLDIRYATKANFTGRILYSEARAFLQKPAAQALLRAHRNLKKKELGLSIYDGYRPWSVVKTFWDVTAPENRKFVADPRNGSVHSRGCAVDLTLFDLKTGKPVEMPSEFDEWSERSYLNYAGGSSESRKMREMLRTAMEAEGFIPCELEWWHYTYKDWEEYRNMDLKFDEIERGDK
jgi:zinc D-Ala-D-Ala dipeptidase